MDYAACPMCKECATCRYFKLKKIRKKDPHGDFLPLRSTLVL